MKRENKGVRFRTATQLLYAGALLFMALLTQSSRGQGQINFNNYVPTANPPIDAKIYGFPTTPPIPLSGTDATFRAALIGGPTNRTPTSEHSIGTLSLLASPYTANTWITFRTGANAGYVAVGTDGARDSGLPYASIGLFQIVIWHGTETTWAGAYADFQLGLIPAGWSAPLTLKTTSSASDPNIPNLTGLSSFFFYVPEPSSFILVLIGSGVFVIRWKYGRSTDSPKARAKRL